MSLISKLTLLLASFTAFANASGANLQTSDSVDSGEYNFMTVGMGLWDCSQVGLPESNQALLAVGTDNIGLYLADEAITFEGFKFTSSVFRRNHYVVALDSKWLAFREDGRGETSELEFNYDFKVLTKRVHQAGIADISNYHCRRKSP